VIFDPPRAGLSKKIIRGILKNQPKRILYISCNPSTQARDVKMLEEKYKIIFFKAYNFFPRTPHIESVMILDLK
jgi:23S rRNA (uracil1939-C5)-methyltransferase